MKFLWYNDQDIRCYLRQKRETETITEHEFGNKNYQNLYKINKLFSSAPWGMIHDISNHVPHPFNVGTNIQYQYNLSDLTFGGLCLQTAKKIADSTIKPLAVCWSGGIDSTAALTALLQTVDRERITVVCNRFSIDEHPGFYQDVIKDRIKTLNHLQWIEQIDNFYSISGDAGDTVWGVIDESFWNNHNEHFDTPWQDWINTDIGPDIEFVEEFCSWSGVKINTVIELRTWFYLCCKWQDKAMRFFMRIPGLTAAAGNSFYNLDNRFCNWTMNNLDKIIGNSWQDYKVPAKQFIDDFYQDTEWLSTKTKVDSTTIKAKTNLKMLLNDRHSFAITADYRSHALPCWPFVDIVNMEDWNDQHKLWDNNLFLK
jgi:hypothetical protein